MKKFLPTGTCVDGNPRILKNIEYITPLNFKIDSLCRMADCGNVGKKKTPFDPSFFKIFSRSSFPRRM